MCEPSSQTKQLLNDIVDARASKDPKAIYAELPLSPTSFDDGFRKVTYWEFANAINGMAWWMMQKLGTGKDFETLLYLGPSDIRHNVLLLGAVKAGYKVCAPGSYIGLRRMQVPDMSPADAFYFSAL